MQKGWTKKHSEDTKLSRARIDVVKSIPNQAEQQERQHQNAAEKEGDAKTHCKAEIKGDTWAILLEICDFGRPHGPELPRRISAKALPQMCVSGDDQLLLLDSAAVLLLLCAQHLAVSITGPKTVRSYLDRPNV